MNIRQNDGKRFVHAFSSLAPYSVCLFVSYDVVILTTALSLI